MSKVSENRHSTQYLLNGNIRKAFFSYLAPSILAMIASSFYFIVDVMCIGIGLGGENLAALNIATPVFFLYTAFSTMLGIGCATLVSIRKGSGDPAGARRAFTLALGTAFVVGLAISVMGNLFLESFARLLGARGELLPLTMDYLKWVNGAAVAFVLSGMLQLVIQADENPRLVMAAVITGNVLNIIFDYLCVFVWKMGMQGAAIPTAFSPVVTLLILSVHFLCRKGSLRPCRGFFDRWMLGRMVSIGFSSFLIELSAGVLVFVQNLILLRVSGQSAVTIYSVVAIVLFVVRGIYNGIANASKPVVSVNYGAGQTRRAVQARRCATLTALAAAVFFTLVIFLFPSQIMYAFMPDSPQLVAQGVLPLRLYYLCLVFMGVNTISVSYFQSVERAGLATFVSVMKGLVLVLAALAVLVPFWGENGVWLATAVAEACAMAMTFLLERRMKRQNPVPERGEEPQRV